MAISDKLTELNTTKQAIKQAIIDKGVAMDNVPFTSYGTKVEEIQGGGSVYEEIARARLINNVGKITDTRYLFSYSYPSSLPIFDTSDVIYANNMFAFSNVSTIPSYDFSSVTQMNDICHMCQNLSNIQSLDLSNVEQLYRAFYYCNSLVNIDNLSVPKVTDFASCFQSCVSLKSISIINMNNATRTPSMFYGDKVLETITGLNLQNVTSSSNANNMFQNCNALKNIQISNIGVSIGFLQSILLTHDSLMNIINNLKDLTGLTSQTLTIGATNIAKLTSTKLEIATNKNWVVN